MQRRKSAAEITFVGGLVADHIVERIRVGYTDHIGGRRHLLKLSLKIFSGDESLHKLAESRMESAGTYGFVIYYVRRL